jgi:Peptidase C13 family
MTSGLARTLRLRAAIDRWPSVGPLKPWRRLVTRAVILLALSCVAIPAFAQDTHLLVIAGVGGDEEHVKAFNKYALAIVDAAKKHGMADANIAYLGENPEQSGGRMKARATRENVTRAFTDLAAQAKAIDEVFIVLIGHGSFDGRQAAFNLPGPDLTADDYKTLLAKFPTQKVVFVNTASSSGAFVQALAGPARTIVTATKTGGERNETRFAQYFAEAFDGDAADRDRNGRVSVQEAFDYAAQKVKAAYEQEGHILTEHATLDDSNQGKLASTQFLAPERSRTAAAQAGDPALRALLEQRDALERQVAELRLRKDTMDAKQYDDQLEKLLTDLALKTRAIRDFEQKNEPKK